MKIGVLTHHSNLNYGANLQAYSLSRLLQEKGHEVWFFDYPDQGSHPLRKFAQSQLQLTEPCVSEQDFRTAVCRYGLDLLLVGSDSVLRFRPDTYPTPFWLEWAAGLHVRRVLFSASCMGMMHWKLNRHMRRRVREALARFDYVSVRDRWTLDFVRRFGRRDAELGADPTSQLDVENFLGERAAAEQAYIMVSFSPFEGLEEWLKQFRTAAAKQGLSVRFAAHPDRLLKRALPNSSNAVLDPRAWLGMLSGAAGYIGERFHPVYLSALLGVPFAAADYYHNAGLSRILGIRSKTEDFCRQAGLMHRYFTASGCRRRPPEELLALLQRREEPLAGVLGRALAGQLERALG